jgi:hypothetical protein
MAELDLAGASNPVMRAARHFGINTDFAYLIVDGLLAADGRGVWPVGHYWHGWAADQAVKAHGVNAAYDFAQAMYRHQQGQAHG